MENLGKNLIGMNEETFLNNVAKALITFDKPSRIKTTTDVKLSDKLILKLIHLDEKYLKKWNVNDRDFYNLYYDGEKVSDSIYRIGLGSCNSGDGRYFMVFKEIEDFYSDSITKVKKDKRHLSSCECIINEFGVEKKVFDSFETVYLTGGVVYSINSKYYNIETDEMYCDASTSMKTENYIFLHNEYDSDKDKRGVLKINKNDGSFELIN